MFEIISIASPYFEKLLGPENIWGIIIAVVLLIYIKTHDNDHKRDDKCFDEWKELVTKKFESISETLEQVKHILDKYVFKFESEEQKEYRERMDRIIIRIRNISIEMALVLKRLMLEAQGKAADLVLNNAIQTLCDLRAHFKQVLIKDGFDAQAVDSIVKTNEVIFPLINDKLKHIVEIATDKSLNGSKPYAIAAMIKELELTMLDKWEMVFVSEVRK